MHWLLVRLKWACLLLTLAVLIIVVFQNLEPMTVTLLFTTATLPQAAVLTITLIIGFLLGLATQALWRMRAWQKGRARESKEAHAKETHG